MNLKTIPLFVSSTFQDMHAERDYLKENIFPLLEERLIKRNCQLEVIDLRWGVFTENNKEALNKEIYVLSVCMNELEKSRPYFLGILGNRYGWIPPKQTSDHVMQEFGINIDVENKSITELEILSGSLEAPIPMKPLFFFRDKSVINLIPLKEKANYSDLESGRIGDHKKLNELKEKLKNAYPDNTHIYKANWDENQKQISGLKEFGELVFENLWIQFNEDTKNLENKYENWVQETNLQIMSKVTQYTQNSIQRKNIITDLYSKLQLNEPLYLTLTGDAGSGKTTIISQLAFELKRNKNIVSLIHLAGLGARLKDVDDMLMRFIELLKYELKTEIPNIEEIHVDELDTVFMQLLNEVCRNKKVVIIIDEIHQMDKSEKSRYLIWFKRNPSKNCHLIISGKSCDQIDTLNSRANSVQYKLPDINEWEAKSIVYQICQKYHRNLNSELLNTLLEKTDNKGKALFSNPLWLTIATEQINLVRYEDFLQARNLDKDSPEKALILMLKGIIINFPSNNCEMYNYILNYFEKVYGEEKVGLFASLLSIARQGLRIHDLKVIIEGQAKEFSKLDLSRLILAFRGHLTSVTDDGKLYLMSDDFKESIAKKYLNDKNKELKIHSILSQYLYELHANDPLKSAELMYHFIKAEKYPEAMNYFRPTLPNDELNGTVVELAEQFMNYQSDENNPELGVGTFLNNFIQAKPIEEWDIFQFLIQIIMPVDKKLENKLSLKSRQYLLSRCLSILEDLSKREFENDYLNKSILFGQHKLTEIKSSLGNAGEETSFYLDNFEKFKTEYIRNPKNISAQQNFSILLFKKGTLLMKEGLADEALDLFLQAYVITVESGNLEPENPLHQIGIVEIQQQIYLINKMLGNKEKMLEALDIAHNSAVIVLKLDNWKIENHLTMGKIHNLFGDFEEWTGDYNEAFKHFFNAFQINQELNEKHPDNLLIKTDLAICNYRLGTVLKTSGEVSKALSYARDAVNLFTLISQSDNDNHFWFHDKTRAESLLKELKKEGGTKSNTACTEEEFIELKKSFKKNFHEGSLGLGKYNFKEAAEYFQQALEDISKCCLFDENNNEFQLKHALTLTRLANSYEFMGLFEVGLTHVNEGYEIAKTLVEKEPGQIDFQELFGEINYRKAYILYRMQNRTEAAIYAKKAYEICSFVYESDEENEYYEIALEDAEDLWDIFK